MVGNGALVLAKAAAGWLSGSTALLATAVDSATDLVYTLFMAWGLWYSQQPADESHPQGHARVEPIVSAVIARMMGLAGLEVVRRAIDRLLGEPVTFAWGGPAAVLIGNRSFVPVRIGLSADVQSCGQCYYWRGTVVLLRLHSQRPRIPHRRDP